MRDVVRSQNKRSNEPLGPKPHSGLEGSLSLPALDTGLNPSGIDYLQAFILRCKPRKETLLATLDRHLVGRGSSENTRRAYLTDIYQALTIKLFHQYDLPRQFDPCAVLLMSLHSAHSLNSACESGTSTPKQVAHQLSQLVAYWEKHRPGEKKPLAHRLLPQTSLTSTISVEKDRLTMSLRGAPEVYEQMAPSVARTDRSMVDCFMGVMHPFLDKTFWDSIINVPSVSNLLTHLALIGNDENTRARKMSSYRVFERFLFEHGLLSKPCVMFMRSPRIVPRAQVTISPKQVREIKEHLNKTVKMAHRSGTEHELLQALRNRAVFAVAHYTGIRAQAICNLTLGDFNLQDQTLLIHEKGRKEVIKPLGGWALPWVTEYMEHRERMLELLHVNPNNVDNLFFSRRGLPLQRKTLASIFVKVAKEAGISVRVGGRRNFGPHADRRSRARELHEHGASIDAISKFLNHAHPGTTERYLRGSAFDQRKMLEQFDRD